MANSKRKCRYCGERKRPEEMDFHNGGAFCKEGDHAVKYALENREKGRKKLQAEKKRKHSRQKREFYENDIKTRRQQAVYWFNRFIRLRDCGQACISCGKPPNDGRFDAGHYITAGSCSALRFDEQNVNLRS